MAAPNLDEITTSTLRNRSKQVADNCTNSIAFLKTLRKKGNVKPADGGEDIVQPLEYALNATAKWYSGYETLDITPQEILSAAHFPWKQAAVSVSISGLEGEVQNVGKEKVIDLLEVRIKNAEKSLIDLVATAVYADGTGSSGKEITGLQAAIADTPTNTYGNIARGTYTWWKNVVFDCSDAGAAMTSANAQTYMNQTWLQVVRGTERPDLIIADNTYYRNYWESLQAIQRVTSTEMAEAGFENLMYMSAPVVFDGGKGGHCPPNHMYFINTDYLFFRPAVNRNFVPLKPDRHGINQDATVKLMGFAGNMTASNCQLQAVIKA